MLDWVIRMQIPLRTLRQQNNMTLAELGRRLGKSRQYMSELERGNIRLTYDMAVKIAQVFDTTPDEIFLSHRSKHLGLSSDASMMEGSVPSDGRYHHN